MSWWRFPDTAPEENLAAIVSDGEVSWPAWWDADQWEDNEGYEVYRDVIWWMPLPEPPR